MNKFVVVSYILVCMLFVSCQKKSIGRSAIPGAVVDTFHEMFQGATQVHWDKVNDLVYKADFVDKGKKVSVLFNMDGVWQKTTRQINQEDLPDTVVKEIDKNFKNDKIVYAATVKNMIGMNYKIDLKHDSTTIELTYDLNGDLINHISK